jgi:hypothetical protein
LDWYDYVARSYGPAIGRWGTYDTGHKNDEFSAADKTAIEESGKDKNYGKDGFLVSPDGKLRVYDSLKEIEYIFPVSLPSDSKDPKSKDYIKPIEKKKKDNQN